MITLIPAALIAGDAYAQEGVVPADPAMPEAVEIEAEPQPQQPAAPDATPETAAGLTEAVGQPTYVLSAGAGEMRIVSGSRGIVFDTDPMLRDLLRGCRSQERAVMPVMMDAADGADTSR